MKPFFSSLALFVLILFFVGCANAASMENSSYILDLNNSQGAQPPNVTPTPPILLQNQTNLTKTVSGDNFISLLSYDGDTKNLPLVLSVSSDLLNFGTIQPGEPIIRTHALTVLPGSAPGYQVISYQNHTLAGDDGIQIPNTTCDNGSCTPILPDVWAIPLTYGFGYRCDNIEGNACDPDLKKDYYKSFANDKADEFPAAVLSEEESLKSQAIISYKVNISGNQANKPYQTTIYHIATSNL